MNKQNFNRQPPHVLLPYHGNYLVFFFGKLFLQKTMSGVLMNRFQPGMSILFYSCGGKNCFTMLATDKSILSCVKAAIRGTLLSPWTFRVHSNSIIIIVIVIDSKNFKENVIECPQLLSCRCTPNAILHIINKFVVPITYGNLRCRPRSVFRFFFTEKTSTFKTEIHKVTMIFDGAWWLEILN